MNTFLDKEKLRGRVSGKLIQNIVFGAILVVLFLLACRMFAPFFTVLMWSALLYLVIEPLFKKIDRRINNKTLAGKFLRTLLAGTFALASVLIVFIPLMIVVSMLYIQGIELIKGIKEYVVTNSDIIDNLFLRISGFIKDKTGESIAITPAMINGRIYELLNGNFNSIFKFSSEFLRGIGVFLLSLVLMVFCLFFFYLDAPYLSNLVRNVIPIKKEHTETLVNKFKEIGQALILGYITVALVQALIAFTVFSIFQVEGALVFACLTFVCVFIPMLGGAIVWLPVGIIRIASGDITGGIALTIISGVSISLLDNLIRPLFLKDRLQLHPLVIFFSILGGIAAFGFNGLILGPLIVVLFLTVLELFRAEYHLKKLNKDGG